jgi:hypothetical protein
MHGLVGLDALSELNAGDGERSGEVSMIPILTESCPDEACTDASRAETPATMQ